MNLGCVGWVTALMLCASGAAFAGGVGLDEDHHDDGPFFFGFVKDAKGNTIADARVSLTSKVGGATLITRSDPTGAYRVPGLRENDPDQLVITCSKDGYRFDAVQRRNSTVTPGTPIEADCLLTKQ
jgi:hypothetical protein